MPARIFKSLFRHRTVPLDLISEETGNVISEYSDILETVLSLPDKYKNVIYLHYYEGYTAKEIGRILNKRKIRFIPCCQEAGNC